MAAFHVYVEGPVDRTADGIQRLAVAISQKYGLAVPDLVKRMTAGRFRVKANVDAATADTYARALEEVGARVKVEEAHPTQPSIPIVAPGAAPAPPVVPPTRSAASASTSPRSKPPTLPGEKPSRSGRYSVSPPRSGAGARAKTPSAPPAPAPSLSSAPPREAHPSSQLMPLRDERPAPPSVAPPPARPAVGEGFALDDDPFDSIALAPSSAPSPSPSPLPPPSSPRPGSAVLPPPNVARPATSSLPPATARPATSSLPPATARPATSSLPPATERSGSSSLPPANAPRPASSSLPPQTERPGTGSLPPANASRASNPAYQSGLSAAYSQEIALSADLGALGHEDSFSLSSLDGNDATAAEPDGTFGPPPVKFIQRPATAPAAPPPPGPITPPPFDLFLPPDAGEAEQEVKIAVDTTPAPPRTRAATTPALGTTPAMKKQPLSQGQVMGGVVAPEMPRSRIIAGVVLAILIGFIPAHLIASRREDKAFAKIDADIVATQSAADTPETYAALDSFRAQQLDRKESERRSIALTSMLIWAVVAAGLGYVWFRRIPWDRMPRA